MATSAITFENFSSLYFGSEVGVMICLWDLEQTSLKIKVRWNASLISLGPRSVSKESLSLFLMAVSPGCWPLPFLALFVIFLPQQSDYSLSYHPHPLDMMSWGCVLRALENPSWFNRGLSWCSVFRGLLIITFTAINKSGLWNTVFHSCRNGDLGDSEVTALVGWVM